MRLCQTQSGHRPQLSGGPPACPVSFCSELSHGFLLCPPGTFSLISGASSRTCQQPLLSPVTVLQTRRGPQGALWEGLCGGLSSFPSPAPQLASRAWGYRPQLLSWSPTDHCSLRQHPESPIHHSQAPWLQPSWLIVLFWVLHSPCPFHWSKS